MNTREPSNRYSPHGNGYILLWRKALTSAVFHDPITWKIFCWCLLRANFEPIPWDLEGEQIDVERGQFVMGTFSAVEELKMSRSTIWRHLKKLAKWGTISLKIGKKFTVVTLSNYETYQNLEKARETREKRERNERETREKRERNESETPVGTNKEYKENKRIKEYIVSIPANAAEVAAYMETLIKSNPTFSSVDAMLEGNKFFDYFASNGWKVGGKTRMKDWRAAARNWLRNIKDGKYETNNRRTFGSRAGAGGATTADDLRRSQELTERRIALEKDSRLPC